MNNDNKNKDLPWGVTFLFLAFIAFSSFAGELSNSVDCMFGCSPYSRSDPVNEVLAFVLGIVFVVIGLGLITNHVRNTRKK